MSNVITTGSEARRTAPEVTATADAYAGAKLAFNLKEALAAEISQAGAFDPRRLLAVCSRDPLFNSLLEANAGVWERQRTLTVRQHVESILEAFTKYRINLSSDGDVLALDNAKLALIMVLHDLGKILPPELKNGIFPEGNAKENQHARTTLVLEHFKDSLPFSAGEMELARFLIGNDCLGSLFKSLTRKLSPPVYPEQRKEFHRDSAGRRLPARAALEAPHRAARLSMATYSKAVGMWEDFVSSNVLPPAEMAQEAGKVAEFLKSAANKLGLTPQALLRYQTLYFQLDIHAYSADSSGGTPSLDYLLARNPEARSFGDQLFLFDSRPPRFIFSKPYEAAYKLVESQLGESDAIQPRL